MALDGKDYRLVKEILENVKASSLRQNEYLTSIINTQHELLTVFKEVAQTLKDIHEETRPRRIGRRLIAPNPANKNGNTPPSQASGT